MKTVRYITNEIMGTSVNPGDSIDVYLIAEDPDTHRAMYFLWQES